MIVDDILIACDRIKALALMFNEDRDIFYYVARTRLEELVKLMDKQKSEVDYEQVLIQLDEVIKMLEEEEDVQASVQH